MDVRFRSLTDHDLPMLHAWLNEPGVARWWDLEDLTPAGVAAKYAPATNRNEQYIAVVDGRDVGWVQTYALTAWPDYQQLCTAVGVDPRAGGFDYLLGSAADRGRGVGSAMLAAFSREVAFELHGWPQLCAGPHPGNVASWRALEKAGFHHAGDVVGDNGPEKVMVRGR